MSFYKVTKKKLKECAVLQPLDYFEKYLDILIHNFRVELQRANKEKHRGPQYYMTYEVLLKVNAKPILKQIFFLLDIIRTKKEMIV